VLYHGGALRELAEVFYSATRWAYYLVMPVMVFMLVRAEDLLHLFGRDFPAGALVLQILCLGQIVNASTGNAGSLLIMSGRQWLHLLNNAVLMVANVVLCVWLAPSWGAVGVAVAAAVANALVNLVRAAQLYYLFGLSVLRWELQRVSVAAGLGALALWMPLPGLTARLLGGAGLYVGSFLVLLWLVGIPPQDRGVVRQLLAGRLRPAASAEGLQADEADGEARNWL
jgi:O-antigen/teichoic acid export membrane protein